MTRTCVGSDVVEFSVAGSSRARHEWPLVGKILRANVSDLASAGYMRTRAATPRNICGVSSSRASTDTGRPPPNGYADRPRQGYLPPALC